MLAITLWQPWATMMALGAKRQETRSWRPTSPYSKGWVGIHAAKTPAHIHQVLRYPFNQYWTREPQELPLGAIVAIGYLSHFVQITEQNRRWLEIHKPHELGLGDYSPDRWAWIFTEIHPLREPMPYRGGRRLFDVPEIDQWPNLV